MIKKLILFLLFSFFFQSGKAQNEFITIWKPGNTSTNIAGVSLSTSNQIWFPGKGNQFNVYWEEIGYPQHNGILQNVTALKQFLIDFGDPQNPTPANATYKVKISNGNGTFQAIRFPEGVYVSITLWPIFLEYNGDKEKILEVSQWGNIIWENMEWAFSECIHMNVTATDAPDLSQITSTYGLFYNCTSLTGTPAFDTWNTSGITNMSHMFAGATNFNQPVGSWNTANVTNMNWLFHYLDFFNQPIGNWNTSKVTTMIHMLHECYAFNQDLSSWDTSKVTDMRAILGKTTNFNHSLGNWNLNSLVLASGMLTGSGLSCEKYNNTLMGWANNPATPNNLIIGDVSPMAYSSQPALNARNNLINTKGWTITGDYYNTECVSLSTSEVLSQNEIRIYPNPAADYIYIKNVKGFNTYKIFDMSGRIILQDLLNDEKINISSLIKGNYILQIITKDKVQSLKFIKN
ncbi:BspA family leucine-rich repeat surface protein [Chryseobacterium sp. LAM-KRS1]|uniref:BspA family leucine-rich repeat surface protein n=1 Tax=Chryseobacterium sp. LAM-KRS1 TaxID=2715754 RepID=UPI001552CE46|nr:BspA family leucine-rich repeat surface protein [Chryseobacterium sp. LAM-KRS1]